MQTVLHQGRSKYPDAVLRNRRDILNSRGIAYGAHRVSPHSGKKSLGSCGAVAVAACPQVIGDGGGAASAGEEGGDGDGDAEPPTVVLSVSGMSPMPPRRNWFVRFLLWLFTPIVWLYQRLPRFETLIRSFLFVFPDDIHVNIFAPAAQRLLDEIADDRFECLPLSVWTGFWRRVRFADLILLCFLAWAIRLLRLFRQVGL